MSERYSDNQDRSGGGALLIDGRRYSPDDLLYQGTDSRIYSVHSLENGVDSAFVVKTYACEGDDERLERAMREMETLMRLRRCPHVVKLLAGCRRGGEEENAEVLLLFEKLPCCADLRPDARQALVLGADICAALEDLWWRRLVHGDIKPSNLYYHERYGWQLGDFGSVCVKGEVPVYGSLAYCAPEAWRGEPCDTRADLYSLGITLYRLLSGGRLPFCDAPCEALDDEAVYAAIERRMRGEALPPVAGIDGAWNRVLLKMCAFAPDERYRRPRDVLREIGRLL